jgi:hypothetical protein
VKARTLETNCALLARAAASASANLRAAASFSDSVRATAGSSIGSMIVVVVTTVGVSVLA